MTMIMIMIMMMIKIIAVALIKKVSLVGTTTGTASWSYLAASQYDHFFFHLKFESTYRCMPCRRVCTTPFSPDICLERLRHRQSDFLGSRNSDSR